MDQKLLGHLWKWRGEGSKMWGHYAFCLKTIEIELALVPILGSKIFFKIGTNMQCLFGNDFYPSITKISPKPMLPLLEKRGRGLPPFSMIFFLKPPTTKMTLPQYIGNETPSQEIIQRKNASIGKCNYWYLLFNCKATLGNNSFYCGWERVSISAAI